MTAREFRESGSSIFNTMTAGVVTRKLLDPDMEARIEQVPPINPVTTPSADTEQIAGVIVE
jgi:hypothetical protein